MQHELRELDEELLFQSLETLGDNLVTPSGTSDRRSELMALSVDNFICLAHTLMHEDDTVTAHASRAICALEDLVGDQFCFCSTLIKCLQSYFILFHGKVAFFYQFSLSNFPQQFIDGAVILPIFFKKFHIFPSTHRMEKL